MIKTLHIFVEGRVQGVYYRASTKQKAIKLQLKGWVRNLSDGRVEIMAQGEQKQLDELVNWCYQGSKYSLVTKVNTTFIDQSESFSNFDVRY